jgi:hypothetical protein
MGDISFTEMGKALDAASQSRAQTTASETTGSPDTQPSTAVPDNTAPEANPSGQGSGGDGQPSKQADTPPAGKDSKGSLPDGSTAGADDKASDERKKWNRWHAQRRIAAKEEKKRRYMEERARLLKEHDSFDAEGENRDEHMAAVKADQIRELDLARIREQQEEWERDAYDTFSPEDAAVFIEDTKRLGDWLNTNEPELLSYLDRPYGKHLLKGWIDKVAKVKEMADRWESMNSFEKYRLIDKFYNELEKFGEDYAAGKVTVGGAPDKGSGTPEDAPKDGPVNVPVPGSGRNTEVMPPSNNFALMLMEAENKRKRK